MLHERDLNQLGTQGWGLFSVEHVVPRSSESGRSDGAANKYSNCIWCCTRCNSSRNARPVKDPTGKLLNPAEVAWGRRFRMTEDMVFEVTDEGDQDAERTLDVYNLNDRLKVRHRRVRREAVRLARKDLKRTAALLEKLRPGHPKFDQRSWVQELHMQALVTLQLWTAIPADNPTACRCDGADNRELPSWLEDQLVEVGI